MNCNRHPDRRAFSVCMKYNLGYCEECCTCTDPRGYCKFRTRCIAWQICQKKQKKKLPAGRSEAAE